MSVAVLVPYVDYYLCENYVNKSCLTLKTLKNSREVWCQVLVQMRHYERSVKMDHIFSVCQTFQLLLMQSTVHGQAGPPGSERPAVRALHFQHFRPRPWMLQRTGVDGRPSQRRHLSGCPNDAWA